MPAFESANRSGGHVVSPFELKLNLLLIKNADKHNCKWNIDQWFILGRAASELTTVMEVGLQTNRGHQVSRPVFHDCSRQGVSHKM